MAASILFENPVVLAAALLVGATLTGLVAMRGHRASASQPFFVIEGFQPPSLRGVLAPQLLYSVVVATFCAFADPDVRRLLGGGTLVLQALGLSLHLSQSLLLRGLAQSGVIAGQVRTTLAYHYRTMTAQLAGRLVFLAFVFLFTRDPAFLGATFLGAATSIGYWRRWRAAERAMKSAG